MKYIFPLIIALGFSVSGFAQPPAGEANVGDAYGAKIKAKILEVCPNKGCWLKLELPDGNQAMVKMKDYGFFVPLAAKGKEVVIEGEVSMKTTSVKELKHYAEDAKKSQAEIDAITQPKKEVNILAKGIVVVEQ